MRKALLACALAIIASFGVAAQSAAATNVKEQFYLTLHNNSNACVWVTLHDYKREIALKVLEPGKTWEIAARSGNSVKVRAQFWQPGAGCSGSFFEDRYDYISAEGYSTLTILTIGKSYIMRAGK